MTTSNDAPAIVLPESIAVTTGGRKSRIAFDRILAVLLVLPSIIAIAIFVYGFIGWTVRVSLSKWTRGLIADYTWDGLKRYAELFHDRRFMEFDLPNTAVFTILFLILCLVIGLFLAILLDQKLKGETFFRSVYLFPMAISFIVTGVAWRWLMNPATGSRISGLTLLFSKLGLIPVINLLNQGFQSLGLDLVIQKYHTNPVPIGIGFVVIPAVWQMAGFTMAMYLGGLRSIPDDLREAARVDGASEFQIYRYIILPLLQPVTLSAVIILGHISLKIFDLIVAIGQNNLQLDVPSVYMWRTTFDANNYARGASIGVIMLVMVAILIIPYLVFSLRTETEL